MDYNPNKMLLKLIGGLGVAFLVVGGYFYVDALRDQSLNLKPVSMPVSLALGTIQTPEFQADFENWEYEITITFERNFDPSLIDISWRVFEQEKVIAEGDSSATRGMIEEPGVAYERVIGFVPVKKGHRYNAVLTVSRDASELDAAQPNLVVQIPSGYWDDDAMGIGIGKMLGGTAAAIGCTLWGGIFVVAKSKRRAKGTPELPANS